MREVQIFWDEFWGLLIRKELNWRKRSALKMQLNLSVIIGHFRVVSSLCFKVRQSANSHANKTHFHNEVFPLSLVLKVSFWNSEMAYSWSAFTSHRRSIFQLFVWLPELLVTYTFRQAYGQHSTVVLFNGSHDSVDRCGVYGSDRAWMLWDPYVACQVRHQRNVAKCNQEFFKRPNRGSTEGRHDRMLHIFYKDCCVRSWNGVISS